MHTGQYNFVPITHICILLRVHYPCVCAYLRGVRPRVVNPGAPETLTRRVYPPAFRFFEIFSIYILHLAPRMAELIGHLKNVNRESNLYISERDNLVTFAPFDTDDSTVVSSQFFHNPRHIEYRT
jgi:hypothetical protein